LRRRHGRQARQHILQVANGSTPTRWHVNVKLNISGAAGHPTVNQFLRPMAITGWDYMAMVKIRSRE
jgi:hypothetical protein